MPALNITAVDATANTLTSAAHGLNTGDGPATPRNTSGGTLPAPLAPVTDYWVIRVDANTIKLATSSANALAGTAIDLTTIGSGTNVLEIGIPYRRARTYVAGSQVKSVDLNSLMDALIAIYAFLTGQVQAIWAGLTLAANQHVTIGGTGRYKHGPVFLWQSLQRGITETNITFDGGDFLHANAASALYVRQGPMLLPGQRPLTVGCKLMGTGAAQTVQVALNVSNGDGTSSTIQTLSIVNPPASWAEYTVAVTSPVALAAGKALYWVVNMPLLNTKLSNLGVEIDFP